MLGCPPASATDSTSATEPNTVVSWWVVVSCPYRSLYAALLSGLLALAWNPSRPPSATAAPRHVDIVACVEYHAVALSLANSEGILRVRSPIPHRRICTFFARLFVAGFTQIVCVAPENVRGTP
jgi:hypothetical protein